MQQEAPAPPKPDEAAQIVIAQKGANSGVILRFKSEKKAKDAFKKLEAVWTTYKRGTVSGVFKIEADMFDCIVDLGAVVHISLVVHKVAGKFVPWRG